MLPRVLDGARQRVDLQPRESPGAGSVMSGSRAAGAGVEIIGTSRLADEFLTARVRSQTASNAELQARADARLATLTEQGVTTARLYGRDTDDGVGGAGAFFLLLDEPEVYGLPPDPVVTTRDLPSMWRHAAGAAAMLVGVALSGFLGRRR